MFLNLITVFTVVIGLLRGQRLTTAQDSDPRHRPGRHLARPAVAHPGADKLSESERRALIAASPALASTWFPFAWHRPPRGPWDGRSADETEEPAYLLDQ